MLHEAHIARFQKTSKPWPVPGRGGIKTAFIIVLPVGECSDGVDAACVVTYTGSALTDPRDVLVSMGGLDLLSVTEHRAMHDQCRKADRKQDNAGDQ